VARTLSRIKRTKKGRFQLRLPPEERDVLRRLAGELRDLLGSEDPALARLFPPGDESDPQSDAQYRALVKDDLMAHRVEATQTFERTIGAPDVDEEELSAWLGVVNDLRLVLGTRLDVTEENSERGFPPEDPRAPAFDVYRYLTWLQWQLVEALAEGLPQQNAAPD
jgi:Domain of unknown function (DUF2017)